MAQTLRDMKDNAARYFVGGQFAEALAEYQGVMQAVPDDLAIRQKVAELLQRLGRTPEAVEVYESVATAWARQGWLLRAIALCKVILQLEPGHDRTQRTLAELYAQHRAPTPSWRTPRAPAPVEPRVAQGGGLPRIPLFSRLDRDAFAAVLQGLELRTFKPGEVIVAEGAPGTSMFAVVEGHVKVVRQWADGARRAVAALGEGEFFGEMALLAEGPRLASVVATERTVVLELTRTQLERIVRAHPSVDEVLHAFHQERLLANVLRGSALLSTLDSARREALAQAFQMVSMPAGETLLTQGQASEALYLLLRGECDVVHEHPEGSQSPYPALREGAVFGELSLMLGLSATATVRTKTPCTLLWLDRAACERHLLAQPGMREAFSALIAERLGRTARLFSEHAAQEERLCA